MSYWAGYNGHGLCLTEDEYEEFLNNYVNVQTAAENHEALCEMEKLTKMNVWTMSGSFRRPVRNSHCSVQMMAAWKGSV